jgi:lysozyme
MKVSQHLKNLLEAWEGLRQQAYLDTGKESTIGIGHLLTRSERASGKIIIFGTPVQYESWLSAAEARQLLDQDLVGPESAVNRLVTVPLSQNQFDALVSFTFNLGEHALAGSTLLKLLNTGSYDSVPTQLRRWVHDNGKVVKGLVDRREKEIALWESKDETS